MMKLNFLLSVGVLAAALANVRAISKEELQAFEKEMAPHLKKCSEEFGVTDEQIKTAKEKKEFAGINPCLAGCILKNAKLINEDGEFVPQVAIDKGEEVLSKDEDKATFAEIANDCAKVNEEKVSDGKEGCERGKLLIECFAKHKDSLVPVRR